MRLVVTLLSKSKEMDTVEKYREVYSSFKKDCSEGRQSISFSEYCTVNGIEQSLMKSVLGDEFKGVRSLPGYKMFQGGKRKGQVQLYARIYDDFRALCAEDRQPGSFTAYCREHGVEYSRMNRFMYLRNLRANTLPGYRRPGRSQCETVPFEDVIFEEAGFLPTGDTNVITVSVDGHVAVHFPADTDVSVIARFIKKMGKETGHVES